MNVTSSKKKMTRRSWMCPDCACIMSSGDFLETLKAHVERVIADRENEAKLLALKVDEDRRSCVPPNADFLCGPTVSGYEAFELAKEKQRPVAYKCREGYAVAYPTDVDATCAETRMSLTSALPRTEAEDRLADLVSSVESLKEQSRSGWEDAFKDIGAMDLLHRLFELVRIGTTATDEVTGIAASCAVDDIKRYICQALA